MTHVMSGGRVRIILLLVLLATAAVYLGSLDNEFVHDDWSSVARNDHLRDLRNLGRFFTDPRMFAEAGVGVQTRPVLLVTYALNFFFSESPRGFRLVNLGLHLANVFLVFHLLVRVLGGRQAPDRVHAVALASAALFAVHPINAQAVIYISSRSVLLSTLFYLLGIGAYLSWRSGSEEGRRSSVTLAGFLAFPLLAMMSKENAVSFAPAVLLLEGALFQSRRRDVRSLWRTLLLVALPVGLFLLYRRMVVDYSTPAGSISHWKAVEGPYVWQLATQAKALLVYLKLYLWPRDLALQHAFDHVRSFADPGFLAGGAVILGSLAWALPSWWKGGLVATAVLWFFAGMAPESLVRLNIIVNEHRFYLPGIALIACTAAAAVALAGIRSHASTKSLGAMGVAMAALILILGYRSFSYSRQWKDECTLWTYTARVSPDDTWTQNNLGNCRLLENDLEGAERAYGRAIELDPGNSLAVYNLAGVLERQGRLYPAIALYRKFDELTGGARSAEVKELIRSIQGRMSGSP